MNPRSADAHARIRELFLEASSLPERDREPFLNSLAHDERLQVEDLLTYESDDRIPRDPTAFAAHGWTPTSTRDGAPSNVLPEKVGRYRIVNVLGRGGMGEVYLAEDPDLERQVALKVIRPDFWLSRQAVERFQREARAVSRLSDPGLCQVYETGESPVGPYLAMQYVRARRWPNGWRWRDGATPRSTARRRIEVRSSTPSPWSKASRELWTWCTALVWCTATSNPPTSWSRRRSSRCCSTSGWRVTTLPRASRSQRQASGSAHRTTCRRNSCRAMEGRWTDEATSIPWA